MPTYVFKCPEGHVSEEKMPVRLYEATGGFIPCGHSDHFKRGSSWPADCAEVQVQPVAFKFVDPIKTEVWEDGTVNVLD